MWKCPKCETLNEGTSCIICGTQKVVENRPDIFLRTPENDTLKPNKKSGSKGILVFLMILLFVILIFVLLDQDVFGMAKSNLMYATDLDFSNGSFDRGVVYNYHLCDADSFYNRYL